MGGDLFFGYVVEDGVLVVHVEVRLEKRNGECAGEGSNALSQRWTVSAITNTDASLYRIKLSKITSKRKILHGP